MTTKNVYAHFLEESDEQAAMVIARILAGEGTTHDRLGRRSDSGRSDAA
jgi:hypothetical protein